MEDRFPHICHIIAIGILQKQQVGLGGNVGTSIAKDKSDRQVQPLRKYSLFVHATIAVCIL
jgi:hypothetical protein